MCKVLKYNGFLHYVIIGMVVATYMTIKQAPHHGAPQPPPTMKGEKNDNHKHPNKRPHFQKI